MKDSGYTILAPQMAPYHFELLVPIFHAYGYNLELLPSVDHGAVDAGLKYVNNDICYPSILVTGQIMEAVTSGRYDTDRLAVLITQTGGGCRATNYIALIRKALKAAGLGHVPVISLALQSGLDEHNEGWEVTVPTTGWPCASSRWARGPTAASSARPAVPSSMTSTRCPSWARAPSRAWVWWARFW